MGDNTAGILRMLREGNGYVSGQRMSGKLGISRTAVWKSIEKLRKAGYLIDAVPRMGYLLLSGADVPTSDEIYRLCNAETFGRNVVFVESLVSTNDMAAMLASKGAVQGTVVTADAQTGGRGRRERSWYSPPGCNIYMSVILRPRVPPVDASQIPVLAVIGITRVLQSVCPGLECLVKWPNDVYCGGGKVSGTLCEMKAEPDMVNHVVVGIGLNVNMEKRDDLPPGATSLFIETGKKFSRAEIVARLLESFEKIYMRWIDERTVAPFAEEWRERSMLLGRKVEVRSGNETVVGTSVGITGEGALKLRLEDGNLRTVYAGDATLRKEGLREGNPVAGD